MEDILSLAPQDLIADYEDNLHKLLNEVRNEIEENEMVHGIALKVPRWGYSGLHVLWRKLSPLLLLHQLVLVTIGWKLTSILKLTYHF